jgi:hypothetical protein
MKYKLVLIALLFSQVAIAEPITFIYTGAGSGSLDGSNFSDIAFMVTGFADTDNIVDLGGGVYYVDHSSTEIVLDGIGTYSFTTDLRTFTNNSIVGWSRAGGSGADLYNSFGDPDLLAWDITYSVGPVIPPFFLIQWDFEDVVTDGGILVLENEQVSGSFEAILGEAAIPVAIDIKFCSDPNAFNCKKKGVLPVTIFGTDGFDVIDIDVSTLQLCTEDLSSCTEAPRDYSIADRGDPTTDLGAAMCAIIEVEEGIFEEQDYLNQDGYLDLDAAFEASEVQDMLGTFCSDVKGASSEPLVVIGTTLDGTMIFSVPVPNVGTDQLWKVNK